MIANSPTHTCLVHKRSLRIWHEMELRHCFPPFRCAFVWSVIVGRSQARKPTEMISKRVSFRRYRFLDSHHRRRCYRRCHRRLGVVSAQVRFVRLINEPWAESLRTPTHCRFDVAISLALVLRFDFIYFFSLFLWREAMGSTTTL